MDNANGTAEMTATTKQAEYLKSLMLRNDDYTVGGDGLQLTARAKAAYQSMIQDKARTSAAIKSMLSAGFGRKGNRKGFTTDRPAIRCGSVEFNSRWDHRQNCNNPNCRG